MALSSGELSALDGTILMMTATATTSTIKILKSQMPEITHWRMMLSSPLRKKVAIIVPPPDILSSKLEILLAPFIEDMKTSKSTYLVIVRGMCCFPSIPSRSKYKEHPPCQNVELNYFCLKNPLQFDNF